MKVAVCVSGIPRSGRLERDITKNLKSVVCALPQADVFIGTWDAYYSKAKDLFGLNKNIWSFEEPVINYHPYIDIPETLVKTDKLKKMIKQSHDSAELRKHYSHQTKQIIAHGLMVNQLFPRYDVIIRVRFDTFVYKGADFNPYITECFETGTTFGFAWASAIGDFNKDRRLPKDSQYSERFLFDQLIIHRMDRFDPSLVFDLSKRHLLLPAEFGWWQVMSEPYNNTHVCVCGWANPDKNVEDKYLL